MRRTVKKRIMAKERKTQLLRRNNRKMLRRKTYRKGGFGSARQAFTRRFIQNASQTGKKLGSEIGKDIAGRLTKAALQDENSGDMTEKTKRIVKKAFNVPTPVQMSLKASPSLLPSKTLTSLRKLR